jgi:uncharacterized protein (TIGR00251 family)
MLIRVKVQTKSSQEKVEEVGMDEYKVWTPAAPAEGEANDAVIEILADYFNVAPSLVRIKSGNKSANKLIEIDLGDDEPEEES